MFHLSRKTTLIRVAALILAVGLLPAAPLSGAKGGKPSKPGDTTEPVVTPAYSVSTWETLLIDEELGVEAVPFPTSLYGDYIWPDNRIPLAPGYVIGLPADGSPSPATLLMNDQGILGPRNSADGCGTLVLGLPSGVYGAVIEAQALSGAGLRIRAATGGVQRAFDHATPDGALGVVSDAPLSSIYVNAGCPGGTVMDPAAQVLLKGLTIARKGEYADVRIDGIGDPEPARREVRITVTLSNPTPIPSDEGVVQARILELTAEGLVAAGSATAPFPPLDANGEATVTVSIRKAEIKPGTRYYLFAETMGHCDSDISGQVVFRIYDSAP